MSFGQWTVSASKQVTYRVTEVVDVLAPGNDALADAARLISGARRLVIVDEKVLALRGAEIDAYFEARRITPLVLGMPSGECNKTLSWIEEIVLAADSVGMSRRDPVLAIGGGVVTDVAGMAASLYRRGTPYVRVPTTLIGQVDAAVGAKTAVNLHGGKNRLGSYHPAEHTLIDRGLLATLDDRHIGNGIAEIIKMAVIRDAVLFDLLDDGVEHLARQRFGDAAGQTVMHRAIAGMLAELEPNLWEFDLRRPMDFGHTLSPAVEMVPGIQLLHGEAVSIDIAISCALAVDRGLLTRSEALRVLNLLRRSGLPVWHPACEVPLLWDALGEAARHRGGDQNIPLPVGIGGCVFANDVTEADLCRSVSLLSALLDDAGLMA